MVNKRSIPWIYRLSRPLIAGLAAIGAAVTGYLTLVKFSQGTATCPIKGCDIVLASPYAMVFGQPLALFGFLAYVSMILFAIAPLLVSQSDRKHLRSRLESWTGLLLLAGGTAMMVFSGYLMYLIAFEIKAVCVYCVASAILSTCLFLLAVFGRQWEDLGQLIFTGISVGFLVLVGTLGVYANVKNAASKPDESPSQSQGFAIDTTSGEAEIALAKHLTQVGAKFYGAFWCPHCRDQKQLFGKEAARLIPYVECSKPDGRKVYPVCLQNQVQSYPTWKVNGKTVTGTQSLVELTKLSGYKGSLKFKNKLPDTLAEPQ